MNERDIRRYEMFGRVQTFGKDHQADFTPNSVAAKVAQQGGPTAASREVLLDALRLDLQNVTRTARAIAQDEPGFAAPYALPDSGSQTALLTTADAILLELKKPGIAARFIAHELPADFVPRSFSASNGERAGVRCRSSLNHQPTTNSTPPAPPRKAATATAWPAPPPLAG